MDLDFDVEDGVAAAAAPRMRIPRQATANAKVSRDKQQNRSHLVKRTVAKVGKVHSKVKVALQHSAVNANMVHKSVAAQGGGKVKVTKAHCIGPKKVHSNVSKDVVKDHVRQKAVAGLSGALRRSSSKSRQVRPVKIGHDFCGLQAPLQALEQAAVRYDHVFSSDINGACKAITQRFFPPTETFYDDVLRRDNAQAPYVDLLVFGPPCQPWSSAGLQGGLADHKDRGGLVFESLKYIEAQRPACFVMEEVAAVASSAKHSGVFNKILKRMNAAGCNVTHRILDTLEHGLPQSRPRLYVVGIRVDRDIGTFQWPSPLPGSPVDIMRILPRRKGGDTTLPKDMPKSSRANFEACVEEVRLRGLCPDKAGAA